MVWSAQSQLLPFAEQANLEDLLDYRVPPLAGFAQPHHSAAAVAQNEAAAKMRIPLLLCPSDGDSVPGSEYGGISYPASAGSGINRIGDEADDGAIAHADGVIFSKSAIGFRDLYDGSSNTVAFGEQLLGDGVDAAPGGGDYSRRVIELAGGTQTTPASCDASNAPEWSGQRGAQWVNGHLADSMYNHYYAPNAAVPDCQNGYHNYALVSARSNHNGGVQIALCDGSARFVSDSVAIEVWRALATRHGGEVTGER